MVFKFKVLRVPDPEVDEKATNESLRLVCGAGREMGGVKGTNESLGLVRGAGWQMEDEKATNESLRLVCGTGRPMDVD